MTEEINFYKPKGEHGWMSNFWPSPIVLDGLEYASVEHYYQASKAKTLEQHEAIRTADTPLAAYRLGHHMPATDLLPMWETVKFGVMLRGLRAKFEQNPDLKAKLLATGSAVLHEDSPRDIVWGVQGLDMLGRMLMHLRAGFKGYDIRFVNGVPNFRHFCDRSGEFIPDAVFKEERCGKPCRNLTAINIYFGGERK